MDNFSVTQHVDKSPRQFNQIAEYEEDHDPHRLARLFLEPYRSDLGLKLRYWRDEFIRWDEGAYTRLPLGDLKAQLTSFIRGQFEADAEQRVLAWQRLGSPSDKKPKVRKVTGGLVGNVQQALTGVSLLDHATPAPAWIDEGDGPNPTELLAAPNGIVHLPALADQGGHVVREPTPQFFTFNRLAFEFDRCAPRPFRWLKFLAELWPDDPESINSLQEWFGYLLTPDTRQQKILMMVGPKRAGKGTIATVLRELVGKANVAGPTLNSLTTPFGLAPLLGKSVAIIDDARLSGRTDGAVVSERLLTISGEGAISIDRKHLSAVEDKLSTRFVIISNELPQINDSSGALVSRMIVLRFTQSWYGTEHTGLRDELRDELPGILLWAVEGWKRLRDRGHFIQPASGEELRTEMEDLASPVGAFVRDRCWVGPGERVEISELYRVWCSWCEERGRKEPWTEQMFGRNLRSAVPNIKGRRPRSGGERIREYEGIRLRTDADPLTPPARSAMRSAMVRDTPLTQPVATQGLVRDGPHGPRSSSLIALIDETEKEGAIEWTADHADREERSLSASQADDDFLDAIKR